MRSPNAADRRSGSSAPDFGARGVAGHLLLLASCALLLPLCADQTGAPGPAVSDAAPLHLFDQLDRAVVEGVAAQVARLPAQEPRTLLRLDFESGRFGPLVPFRSGAPTHPASAGVTIVEGERAYAGGRSVELTGDGRGPLSLRTPAIPVSPTEVYELRYRVASDGVAPREPGARPPRGSVRLYRLAPEESSRADALLADPQREKRARLPDPPEIEASRRVIDHAWVERRARFSTGPRATHMVLSFELAGATASLAPRPSPARARFDDIRLTAVREPVHRRDIGWDDGMGAPHPLKRSAALEHPAAEGASERRYALVAPAPSALQFAARVPEGGALSLGYGFLPEARVPGAEPVTFSVEVGTEGGETVSVHRRALDAARARGWQDVEIDLAPWAGRTIRVTLRTEGRPRPADAFEAAQRLPEAGCVFSYPVLLSRLRPGRLVVLVVIDTLPAARTSTYGYARETTPQLTRIAAEGARFVRALSSSSWTLPAFASIFTGLTPGRHRAGELTLAPASWRRPLAADFLTVAERLRIAGWETRAWINNPNLTRRVGLHQGFVGFVDYKTRSREEAAEPGVADLLEELRAARGTDRFFFFHLMDPHGPYRPTDAYRQRFASSGSSGRLPRPLNGETWNRLTWGALVPDRRERLELRESYDAVVAYADAQLGRIYDAVRAAGSGEDITFIVTADHGEEFWEHAAFEHGQSIYDELLRVPLVVVRPGHGTPGRVVDATVGTHDLAATILAIAGLEAPDTAGISLLPVLDGGEPPEHRHFVSASTLYGVERMALEADGIKYLYNQLSNGASNARSPRPAVRHELYDLGRDPAETQNVFRAQLETGLALHEELASQFVSSLGGDYVIAFDAGSAARAVPPVLEGSLLLPVGARFGLFAKEFVWPMLDGGDAQLEVETFGLRRLSFRVRAPRALLGFSVRVEVPGPLQVRLLLNGQPAPRRFVAVGASAEAPPRLAIELAPDEDLLAPEDLLTPRAGSAPRILVGRVRPTPELAGAAGAAPVDQELREQLEALGYVE